MKVQVCDLASPNYEKDLLNSLLNTGFAVVTNHGIGESSIRATQKQWREFFLEGQEIKDVFVNEDDPNLGYKGMKTEKAVGAAKPDLKEYFHFYPGSKVPVSCAMMTNEMYRMLSSIGQEVLDIIDQADGTNYFDMCERSDNTILRTLYYPAMNFGAEQGAIRAAAHEDINFITLLVAASAPGLEVLGPNGEWFQVPHEENSIVVNIGDMLALISKGRYKSTTHRVVNPDNSNSDRVSMPLFIHPHSETQLSPEKTAAQYLAERIAQIHGSK